MIISRSEQFISASPLSSLVNLAILVADTATMREPVMQLFVREFVPHTSIDFCVRSHRIMLLRNNTLRIVNSSRADEGNYVCRAENLFGSAEMTAILWVKGKWRPGGLYFLPN